MNTYNYKLPYQEWWRGRPYETQQPAFMQGANSCGKPKDEDFQCALSDLNGRFYFSHTNIR